MFVVPNKQTNKQTRGEKMKQTFISKEVRNQEAKRLGHNVKLSSIKNQYLNPRYVIDDQEGIKRRSKIGFGFGEDTEFFPILYTLEVLY